MAHTTTVTQCNSCGAPIYWLKHTRTGKPAPIDAKVEPAGNIVIYPDKDTYAMVSAKEMLGFRLAFPDAEFHMNHFATCPQAKTWARHGGRGAR